MKTRFPWLSLRKKTDPEIPIDTPLWFGPRSNGEYFRPMSDRDRKVRKLVLETADHNARRLGMDRREFLASAMGMCTTFVVLNQVAACAGSEGSGSQRNALDAGRRDSGDPVPSGDASAVDSGRDARLCVPKEAQFDETAACDAIGGNEFIFDVQTHWFKKEDLDRYPLYYQVNRALFDRADEDYYVEQMFCNSETTVAALTSWPGTTCDSPGFEGLGNCGLPLSNESMAASRNAINQMAMNTRRLVQHIQTMVQDRGGIETQLRIMEEICANFGASAWKLYPGYKPGYKMTDPNARAVIEKGLSLGLNQFCVHKGLQIASTFDPVFNYPDDIGVVATDYPDARFVIYHSAICSGHEDCSTAPPEGPYDPDEASPVGVNALIRSLSDRGIGPGPGQTPNTNVFGEIGSAMNEVMGDATAAAHFFGKLMKYLGTDHVVWGTDSVIYGTPQRFIEWSRTLDIPQSMQEQFGYPPLDAANKAKIFGLNAARLYGIDVAETRCQVDRCATTAYKRSLDEEFGGRRWMFQPPNGPKTYREFLAIAKSCADLGRPG